MGKGMAKDKDENISIAKLLLTSGVCAAIIAGIFSLVTVWSSNKLTKEIEVQKYEYILHEKRYEQLHDALEYFAGFKVYSTKFISNFDVRSEEYSLQKSYDMRFEGQDEFLAEFKRVKVFLSEDAQNIILAQFNEDDITMLEPDIENVKSEDEINRICKDCFLETNRKYDNFVDVIIEAIEYDIEKAYIP